MTKMVANTAPSGVSVIIPAYNAETCLRHALKSVLTQEPSPLEVIVINDGSTDGTEIVAQSFRDRVTILSQNNAGPAAARNRGLRTATGEFVAFLDADDYWLPGFIASCQDFLRQNCQAVAVSTGLRFITSTGADYVQPTSFAEGHNGEPFLIDDFFSFWGDHDHIRSGSCMLRRETVQKAGLQLENLRLCEDLEYWAYLATFGKWGFEPKILWVCDSERAAMRTGWWQKYRTRRKLCPTVEEWQARILPRLRERDIKGFVKMRGRVAASLAQNHVLAGKRANAGAIIQKYSSELPPTWSSRLLQVGQKTGWLGWHLACLIISSRERQKAFGRPFLNSAKVAHAPSAGELDLKCQANAPLACVEGGEGSGVSVIIPAFNVAQCLARAVKSALSQTPAPLEVVVINDGSSDDTPAIARAFGNRIVYLEQENRGQGAARNAGLKVARGEFVAFLDADDYWLPGFISACVSFLRTYPEAIAVNTGLRFHLDGQQDLILPKLIRAEDNRRVQPWVLHNFFAFWGTHDHVRTGSVMIRRKIIEAAGPQQAHLRISQDLEYWGYLATFGPWGFIPQIYWVCDSERMARVKGWLKKYRKRRKLCPTVEKWQERIVSRLKAEDWPGFRQVRGRVAASFAQNHVLAGRPAVARKIVREYCAEMPAVWSTNLLRTGNRLGSLGWSVSCFVVNCREYQKAWTMKVRIPPVLNSHADATPTCAAERV
jgi:glycosyltransferase involved in cell wall biosynthesis